ncbi:MAG: hypothetical protein PHE59_02195 [Patescibacteria group bacterium]|nr:hypothetical protein [Patescibacteria group bacterium]MDD5164869.1 hypothetical protein [Patescibacteria group bacterium]MDD5534930.1 hypothetical protein [Patescibacteria group bacterium]
MNIQKPFYKMFRPNKQKDGYFGDYVIDYRNILDWSSPIRAFNLIIEDFKKICEYIDPSDENTAVYSHRLYEIFIRTCTELESNMKAILKANGYVKTGRWWDMTDYKKLEPVLKLSDYEVLINFWNNGRGMSGGCVPFRNWAQSKSGILVWYQDYNNVKHSREENFHLASLGNLLDSICGLFIILFSQYGVQIFNPYQIVKSYDEDDLGKIISKDSFIFSIKPPEWRENEKYDFDWDIIRAEKNPFQEFKSF